MRGFFCGWFSRVTFVIMTTSLGFFISYQEVGRLCVGVKLKFAVKKRKPDFPEEAVSKQWLCKLGAYDVLCGVENQETSQFLLLLNQF